MPRAGQAVEREVSIDVDDVALTGDLTIPAGAEAIVVFVHGSGSSRLSSRNRAVARALNDAGLATLLFDLLTEDEEAVDARTRHLRFDIDLLARRLAGTVKWIAEQEQTAGLRVGLFGASTGAAAALIVAGRQPDRIGAVVSRGGRPDLAGDVLPAVQAPVLLIVGGRDEPVIALNRQAASQLRCSYREAIIEGATHLFEETGALEEVAELARRWFIDHLHRQRT